MTTDQGLDVLSAVLDAATIPVSLSPAQHDGSRDHPIVSANAAFCRMVGFDLPVIAGRDCRFVQGTNRHQGARRIMREALERGVPTQAAILNYRADGTSWDNFITLLPIWDSHSVIRSCLSVAEHEAGLPLCQRVASALSSN